MSTNSHESDSFVPPIAPDTQRHSDDTAVDRMIGQRIGNFQVEERLGAGAMASIYRAIDTTTGLPVALKVLSSAADEILRERFRMEARTVSALQHPHIVRTIASGQAAQGVTYIAMELVDGEDLGTLLEKRHQLSVLDSCRLLQPIAAALAHAHAAGVIHRDVKPSNILLRRVPQGTPHSVTVTAVPYAIVPLLSDFGIARAVDAPELTTLGRTIGTPAFMSPEQCAGQRLLDGRADLYSLGAVLYRCLVGRAPFVGTTTQILHAHVYEALTIPDTIWRMLPPAMVVILRKALQKEPNDRYLDGGALAGDLALLIQDVTPIDATATMPSLPVANPADTISQVLIPALSEKSNERPVIPWIPPSDPITPPTRTTINTPTMRRQRRPTNWAALLLGLLLSVGVILLAYVAITSFVPRFKLALALPGGAAATEERRDTTPALTPLAGNLPPGTIDPTEAAGSVAANTTTVPPAQIEPGLLPSPNLPAPTGIVTGATALPTIISTITPNVAPSVTVTTTTSFRNDFDVAAIWQDVQHYYEDGEWGQARWSIVTMLSAKDGVSGLASDNQHPVRQVEQINELLLKVPNAIYWGKWIDTFTYEEVGQILANIYISLAQDELLDEPTLSALSSQTADYLLAAASVQSASTLVRQLSAITIRFFSADEAQKAQLKDELINVYTAYAEERHAAQATCAAAHTVAVADRLVPGQIDATLANSYQSACASFIAVPEAVTTPQPFGGTIYYSSQVDNTYSIWRVPVDQPNAATLLIENGSQPSIYQNQLAFYSRRSDSEGLSGQSLATLFDPYARFPRYTGAVEDARESPARWNPTGTSLVFASTDSGDNKSRLYLVAAEYNSGKDELGLGEDPVWSPDGTTILYRDIGLTGNTPGLVMRSLLDGTTTRLTAAEDRRPIWTADGTTIVFMRRVDERNWELFRLSITTGELVQLTDNPAQDGLPELSPDGDTILFASDRGGGWQLWTIRLTESELSNGKTQLLMPIQGTFLRWLEHSIQWVN